MSPDINITSNNALTISNGSYVGIRSRWIALDGEPINWAFEDNRIPTSKDVIYYVNYRLNESRTEALKLKEEESNKENQKIEERLKAIEEEMARLKDEIKR